MNKNQYRKAQLQIIDQYNDGVGSTETMNKRLDQLEVKYGETRTEATKTQTKA